MRRHCCGSERGGLHSLITRVCRKLRLFCTHQTCNPFVPSVARSAISRGGSARSPAFPKPGVAHRAQIYSNIYLPAMIKVRAAAVKVAVNRAPLHHALLLHARTHTHAPPPAVAAAQRRPTSQRRRRREHQRSRLGAAGGGRAARPRRRRPVQEPRAASRWAAAMPAHNT